MSVLIGLILNVAFGFWWSELRTVLESASRTRRMRLATLAKPGHAARQAARERARTGSITGQHVPEQPPRELRTGLAR